MSQGKNHELENFSSAGSAASSEAASHSKLISELFSAQTTSFRSENTAKGTIQGLPQLELLPGIGEMLKRGETLQCSKANDKSLVIKEDDFKDKFGEQVAKTLKELGCTKIEVNGDRVKLHLADDKEIRTKVGIWDSVKLDKEISFRVKRDGGTITIDDGKGLRLKADSSWVADKDFPSVEFTNGKLELKNYPVSMAVPKGLFGDLDKMLKAVGK